MVKKTKKHMIGIKVVRGECLYQKVAEFLEQELNLEGQVDFEIVSDWVRYDKAIKKVLYVFLSTLEEHFKSIIISDFEYKDNNFEHSNKRVPNMDTFDVINEAKGIILKIKDMDIYRTYFSVFSCFTKWTEDNGDIRNFSNADLDRITKIRNNVMHMSFIALPLFPRDNLKNNLKSDLKLIKDKLPKRWSKKFESEIINCQFSKDENGVRNVPRTLLLEEYIIKEI
jgi:hypothetical protein